MRTSAKQRSLVRQAELELQLAEQLELVRSALTAAGLELDRFYRELELEQRDRSP